MQSDRARALRRQAESIGANSQLDAEIQKLDLSLKKGQQEYYNQFGNIRFIYKIQNGHLNSLLCAGDFEKLKELLPQYIEFNVDAKYFGCVYGSLQKDFQTRWNFWIRKLIQADALEEFLPIIPREQQNTNMTKS